MIGSKVLMTSNMIYLHTFYSSYFWIQV